MLFSRVTPVALFVALATSALGAVNTKQAIEGMNALQKNVAEARKTIEGWNGGLLGVIPVASKIQGVKSSAADTRRTIEQSDAFGDEDQDEVLAAYSQLQPEIMGALNAAEQKAPAFKDAGVAFVARAMMEDLKGEKEKFETAIQGKVPAERYRDAEPKVAEVNAAFDSTHKALAA
ncbi:hypothetical protein ALT_0314 [Aspergillus lentulus]|uniref:Hydrophobic surface binding protein A-domain-containing protein n=1 Tax=Aspergillus lentulus TaxID=293939 RepID=A0AAN6BRX2_ASPLE|nr:uncharacterized protein IFM58399_00712 [Aspergillus lentulus]KAF4163912.1 hypothetical protein CNMCM6936_000136 [Aspergillus lentulus]KAF4176169.1 hypothetical protein CNMCM8060_006586 [Aspergillus lentulus]KAF4192682.1 hypothetical protein CNMCM8694_000082 [Aspergillus lentulus]KAF4206692.1 hypothetical protein CNMCM8927_004465 [Aspergillus lentulus]GAQ02993.1 hypothetical protein ALT_0314 [Aspergillus lentulus]